MNITNGISGRKISKTQKDKYEKVFLKTKTRM